MTLIFNGLVEVVKVTFMQNFIELTVAVHELSCWQRKKLRWKQYCRRYRGSKI